MNPPEIKNLVIKELDLRVVFLGGVSPTTGYGTLADYGWRFRARGNRWMFEVVPDSHASTNEKTTPIIFTLSGEYGVAGDEGTLPVIEALEIIGQCARQFLRGQYGTG
jgi:hypothetical protein